MTTEEKLQKYHDWIFKMSAYRMALSTISVDKQTVAPSGGNAYRDARTAFLAGELFSIETDPEMFEILKELKDDPTIDGDDARAIQLYYKQACDSNCIPKEEFVAFADFTNESWNTWLKAKQANDYEMFGDTLAKLVEWQKKLYGYRDSELSLYDRMLDDYEPGMNQEKYDAFFEQLKERLVPLIRKVTEAKQIDESCLKGTFPIEEQKAFMDEVLEYLGFDHSWGYQNETEHPFTNWICENDCRTTTKYLEDNVISAVLSTVHEVGHAYYEHDVDPKYDGMILSEGISFGMHESQSRLCENYLGRARSFWEYNYPKLQKHFPEQFQNVSLDAFIAAINVARPSLVRTEADELTYPLHILVRYEIEKGLFNGTISTDNLDQTWNAMYEKYLGVKVDCAANGILQDVHWSDGNFGYFPTYALGSAMAAQFVHAMRKDIDVDAALANGHYKEVIGWLKEHVHQYGCRYTKDEVLLKATGEPFNVNYYLDYLEEKYTKLYNL